MKNKKLLQKLRRKRRVSASLTGAADCPRIVIFRSNKYIYAQAIDDAKRQTLAYFSSLNMKKKNEAKTKKTEDARVVGEELAKALAKKGIKKGIFDRSSYAYKGRVKEVAEGLRTGGLKI